MASQTAETSAREIAFDRLPEAGASLEVLLLDNITFHADDECGPFRRAKSLPDSARYENQFAIAEGDYVVLYGSFSGIRADAMLTINVVRALTWSRQDPSPAEHGSLRSLESTA